MIVRYFGVGGTLQIMPVVIGIASGIMIAMPRLATASAMRLSEAAARYSFNRTGMELMYLPLPTALKNRTKAFVDIFMDRFGRGLGAMVLMGYLAVVETDPKHPNLIRISGLIFAICVFWVFLSARVSKEYLATVRKRLESRRLDLSDIPLTVTGGETLRLLERTLVEGTPRQAAYVLGLLADVPGYAIGPHIETFARHASAECRTKAFEVAAAAHYAEIRDLAAAALDQPRDAAEHQAALAYLVALPDHPIDAAWCRPPQSKPTRRVAHSQPSPSRWAAPIPVAYCASCSTTPIHKSPQPPAAPRERPAAAAISTRSCSASAIVQSAAQPWNRWHSTAHACVARSAIFSPIPRSPRAIRRQIPRVQRLIPDQRSVDVLIAAAHDEAVRTPALKALNRLRRSAPTLQFPVPAITSEIQSELRLCFAMHAQMAPLRAAAQPRTATALLVRTLETRVRQGRERAFRWIGLRYAPEAIYNAYLAAESGKPERASAAHEYLDSALDRETKRALLPLLDSAGRMESHANELFHIEAKNRRVRAARTAQFHRPMDQHLRYGRSRRVEDQGARRRHRSRRGTRRKRFGARGERRRSGPRLMEDTSWRISTLSKR